MIVGLVLQRISGETLWEDITVAADRRIARDTVVSLVADIRESWRWEGREVGRIELVQENDREIRVLTYERPVLHRLALVNGNTK